MAASPQKVHPDFQQLPWTSGPKCVLCRVELKSFEEGVAHIERQHPEVLKKVPKGEELKGTVERFLELPPRQFDRKRLPPVPGTRDQTEAPQADPSHRSSERLSPPSSLKRQSSRSSPQPGRSKGRPSHEGLLDLRHVYQDGTTCTSPEAKPASNRRLASQLASLDAGQTPPPQLLPTLGALDQPDDESAPLLKEPETRPISQEQLVAEVKGIYAGLVMVESKCIEVDNAQNAQKDSPHKLNHEQWQALIALHRTLLHEHHDFFLASQHPSASLALQRLASKYSMPARMWRHGIHSFLELLRHRLPASLEHMLTFIYLSYSMMALLYETVPAFEDTWIECLGDLGRYRMAIEDDNPHDREVWTGVSRHWYGRASDKAPTTGRLYHHLAILARPNALQQLFYYVKSLCVPIPFLSARESVLTLFDPILNDGNHGLPPVDASFVMAHAVLFTGRLSEKLEQAIDSFTSQLDSQIGRTTRLWMESGYYIAISNSCALLHYCSDTNPLCMELKDRWPRDQNDHPMDTEDGLPKPDPTLTQAVDLNFRTHSVVLRRYGDPNTYPYLHVVLAFMFHLAQRPAAMKYVENNFPWKLLAVNLNRLASSSESYIRFEAPEFPGPTGPRERPRPLPEDYAMRGLIWTESYYPAPWFSNDKIDDEEKYLEVASMTEDRKVRCLWLAHHIAMSGKWLQYDAKSHVFSVPDEYEVDLEDLPLATSDEAMPDIEVPSRVPTYASATTAASVSRSSSWTTRDGNDDQMEDRVPTLIS